MLRWISLRRIGGCWFRSDLEIFAVRDKDWLLQLSLHSPLLRDCLISVEYLHVITSFDLLTSFLLVNFIKMLCDTVSVMAIHSPVVHQLYVSLRSQSCRPGNWPVSHESYLFLRIRILDGYRRCHWVKVTCHILSFILDKLLPFPQSFALHIKAIEVHP